MKTWYWKLVPAYTRDWWALRKLNRVFIYLGREERHEPMGIVFRYANELWLEHTKNWHPFPGF